MHWLARGPLLLLGGLAVACSEPPPPASPEDTREPVVEPAPPSPEQERDAFAKAVRAALTGERVELGSLPAILRAPSQPIYVSVRIDGESHAASWREPEDAIGPMNWHVLAAALAEASQALGPELTARVTSVEIDLVGDFVDYALADPQSWREFMDVDGHGLPRQLGVLGDCVATDERAYVRAPSVAISSNRTLREHLDWLRVEKWQLSEDQWAAATFSTFTATQWLVTLDPLTATPMFRGNELVELADVDQVTTERFAELAAKWLIANIDGDGRLIHGYAPSTSRELTSQNAIRQWDATNALLHWARRRDDPALFELAARNIEHNLATTFRLYGRFGIVGFDTTSERKGKLGAMAVAALALRHLPERARWAKQIEALRASIDHLAQSDGRFQVFYRGDDDPKYWNFYPGEALLFWAELYAEQPSPDLLAKYRRAFEFYRSWHRQPGNGRAAFAPWHMLANATMIDALAGAEPAFEAELRESCFELADLLLSIQQWEGDPAHPDEWGRFYSPEGSHGTSHATSTGIYTWALVDAFALARATGDSARAERYRVAILRALRNLMQLQFVDEVDMFYVGHTQRVHVEGGVRTDVFDNEIRIDNVGYALLTALAVLETFGERDYVVD